MRESHPTCSHHSSNIKGHALFLQDEAQMHPLFSGPTSYHQQDARERHRGWRPGLFLTHHGGVFGLHQRAIRAGCLPSPRASKRSPPLDGAHMPRGNTCDTICTFKFLKDPHALDPSWTIRHISYFNWPLKLELIGAFQPESAGQVGCTILVCRPGVSHREINAGKRLPSPLDLLRSPCSSLWHQLHVGWLIYV